MAQIRNRIAAAWNMLVSGSPGLSEYARSTVRPYESSNQMGRGRRMLVAELMQGFEKYVAVAQSRNASAVAGVPLRVYRRSTTGAKSYWNSRPLLKKELLRQRRRSGAWTRKAADISDEVDEIIDPLHPLVKLLNTANMMDNGFSLIEQTQLAIGLSGNAYWHPVAGRDGYPVEVWPLMPQFVHVIPSRDTIIGGYVYGRGSEIERTYQASEVIRFNQPNPKGDPYRGCGDLEKCILDAQLSLEFSRIRLGMVDNGAQPGLIVTAEGATDDQRDKLEEIVNQKFASGAKWGRSMVLNGKIAVTKWDMGDKEVAFLNSDAAVRETIANCHDMSSALLTLDSAALATAEAAIPQWHEQAIRPRVNRIVDTLNQALVPMFGDDRLYICSDEVVENNANEDATIAVSLYSANVVKLNESRAMCGFDSVPDGDRFAMEFAQESSMAIAQATTENGAMGEDGAKPVAGGVEAVQDTAMNGAQVASIVEIIRQVAMGDLPASAAKEVILLAFPMVPEDRVDRMLAGLEEFEPTSYLHAEAAAAQSAEAQPDTETEEEKPEPKDEKKSVSHRSLLFGDATMPACFCSRHPKGVRKSMPPDITNSSERDIEAAIRRWFNGLMPQLAPKLGTNGLKGDTLGPMAISLSQNTTEPLGTAFLQGWNFGVQELGKNAGKAEFAAALTGPVAKYLREYQGKLVQSVTESVDERIKEAIAVGIEQGESIPQLSVRLQESVTEMSSMASERIARTETNRAFLVSREKSWMESGAVWGKRWQLAPDACSFCVAAASEYGVQPLGTPFFRKGDTITGAEGTTMKLDYADVEGPPLHPNDRCGLVMVIEEPK